MGGADPLQAAPPRSPGRARRCAAKVDRCGARPSSTISPTVRVVSPPDSWTTTASRRATCLRGEPGEVVAVDLDGARAAAQGAVEQPEQRGLAAPVRADQPEHPAVVGDDIDVLEDRRGAVRPGRSAASITGRTCSMIRSRPSTESGGGRLGEVEQLRHHVAVLDGGEVLGAGELGDRLLDLLRVAVVVEQDDHVGVALEEILGRDLEDALVDVGEDVLEPGRLQLRVGHRPGAVGVGHAAADGRDRARRPYVPRRPSSSPAPSRVCAGHRQPWRLRPRGRRPCRTPPAGCRRRRSRGRRRPRGTSPAPRAGRCRRRRGCRGRGCRPRRGPGRAARRSRSPWRSAGGRWCRSRR